MTESRQVQYLRILTEGPQKTLGDAEVTQWLIDQGYAKGHVRDLSRLRHPTDADVEYVWQGITHKGRIFIEELRSQLEQSKQKPTDRPANHHSQDIKPTVQSVASQVPPVEQKLWYERSTLRAFVFLLGVAVVAAAFAKWLGLAG